MIYKLRKFSKVKAFQYTEAMESGKDPVPEGFDVCKETYTPNINEPQKTEQRNAVKHAPNNWSFLSPGVWVLKCQETGETKAIFGGRYFQEEYEEAQE